MFRVTLLVLCFGFPTLALAGDKGLFGDYRLLQIRCGGHESSAVPDKLIGKGVSIISSFEGSHGKRVTNFLGCEQTISMRSINYHDGVMKISEGAATCTETKPKSCADTGGACSLPATAISYPYQLSEDKMMVTIPEDPHAKPPCGPEQKGTTVFIFGRVMPSPRISGLPGSSLSAPAR